MNNDRKRWPNQIRTIKGMKPGKIYAKIYTGAHYKKSFRDGGLTFISIHDDLNLGPNNIYLIFRDRQGSLVKHFAADSNLVPYKSGWNPTNYIIRDRRKQK